MHNNLIMTVQETKTALDLIIGAQPHDSIIAPLLREAQSRCIKLMNNEPIQLDLFLDVK
jgi:hypothetical protein